MAKVLRPVDARQHALFASVFPTGLIRPPKNIKEFESKASVSSQDIQQILLTDSRTILGIGDETFTLASKKRLTRSSNLFQSYYPSSPPISDVLPPTDEDRAFNLTKYNELQTWRLQPRWQAQLGSLRLEKLFAAVLDRLITEYINWSYSSAYDNGVILHLRFWVENVLAPYSVQFLRSVQHHLATPGRLAVVIPEVSKLQEIALTRLATLRVGQLFDIVVDWDTTAAGVDDLKLYTTNPATRSYVTNDFANVLITRLLHPGASTIEILQVYISIIRAFRRLDPKGVLLERVARKLRRYLRERDDTIKIVVTGLLSDVSDQHDSVIQQNPDVLTELAHELQERNSGDGRDLDGELDWNNMEWLPDPIDAAPDYLKSKNTDVIGSVISLFESKDIFVKELQTTLAERLLRNTTDFDQEIGVIEHLKIRFGDSALQGCEVMLKDVLDSRKVDQVIRQDQGLDLDEDDQMELHSKILSRLFWPTLPEQPFKVPLPVLEQQTRYEKGFESLKQTRKLAWNHSVGQVEVELELEDRTFEDVVLPYQASVIYSFQDTSVQPASRSTSDIATELEMTPTLVRSACKFWVSKHILTETEKDVFTVLESLPEGVESGTAASNARDDAAAEAAAKAAEAQAIKEAEEAERKQKMAIFHQFIVSMLRNQGAMPLPRIAMMLGIVVPGGFPFTNEELKEFLTAMIREGALEMGNGGAYKVAS